MIPASSISFEPIQMLWVRGELSRLELLSINSFLANGHPVHLYTYHPPANVPAEAILCDATAIVPIDRVPATDRPAFTKGTLGSFSDFFRYTLLTRRGGWWSDVDIVCLRPWVFAEPALTASTWELGYGVVANTCVMRFPPNHPVMLGCLEACSRIELDEVGIGSTGPNLLCHHLARLGTETLCKTPSTFCPVPWNASWQLIRPRWQRFTWDELKQRIRRPHLSCRFTRDTVAVHLWNETWRDNARDKSARYPRSCLYERLQRKWNPS